MTIVGNNSKTSMCITRPTSQNDGTDDATVYWPLRKNSSLLLDSGVHLTADVRFSTAIFREAMQQQRTQSATQKVTVDETLTACLETILDGGGQVS